MRIKASESQENFITSIFPFFQHSHHPRRPRRSEPGRDPARDHVQQPGAQMELAAGQNGRTPVGRQRAGVCNEEGRSGTGRQQSPACGVRSGSAAR